jgi:hypothetical protein
MSIWANKFEKDSWHGPHTHYGADFSGIYVVSLEGENPTSFISMGNGSRMFLGQKDTKDVKEGTVMIFPSGLLHYVNPSPGPRVSLAYNLSCTF